MFVRYAPAFLYAASFVGLASAQESIPSDLSQGFSDSTELQCSYEGNAQTGFEDGERLTQEETSEPPTFALGDASGVNPSLFYAIVMVDTTCEDARTLHLVQPDVKPSGEGTLLEALASPLLDYAPPGSLGEQGERQYTFLLYMQRRGQSVDTVPGDGQLFDAAEFQEANSLEDPVAGISMVVDLGGEPNCSGGAVTPIPSPDEDDEEEDSDDTSEEAPAEEDEDEDEDESDGTPFPTETEESSSRPTSTRFATSTLAASSTRTSGDNDAAESTGSSSSSSSPAEQTTNAASVLSPSSMKAGSLAGFIGVLAVLFA